MGLMFSQCSMRCLLPCKDIENYDLRIQKAENAIAHAATHFYLPDRSFSVSYKILFYALNIYIYMFSLIIIISSEFSKYKHVISF